MRFKLRNALIAAVLYLYVLSMVWFLGPVAILVLILYVGACMYAARQMIVGAESRQSDTNCVEFSKCNATVVYGDAWKSFYYVFDSEQQVIDELMTRMGSALRAKLGCEDLKETTLTDIDRELPRPERRSFRVAMAPNSLRKTRFHFLCTFSKTGNVQGVRWWIFVLGERDPNKVFWRYALAPLTVPFVALAYFRREFEPLHGLTSVDPGFFNSVDMLTRTREIEYVAFETLVATLESFGIDTSDLKEQRSNVLNVNVGNGGKATIGSVVQGAFNRLRSGHTTSA